MESRERFFVAFGGQSPGPRPAGQMYTLKGTTTTLPLLICCTTPQQVRDVQRLNKGIKEVSAARGILKKIQAFIASMETLDSIVGGTRTRWYAVWSVESSEGSVYRTIFASYRDYCHLADAAQSIKRRHRRFFNLVHAVVWLLAQGDSSFLLNTPGLSHYLPPADRRKAYDTPSTQTREIDLSVIELSDEEDEGEDLPILGQLPQTPVAANTPTFISLVTPQDPVTPTPTIRQSRGRGGVDNPKVYATPREAASEAKISRKVRRVSGEGPSYSSRVSSISAASSISTVSSLSSNLSVPSVSGPSNQQASNKRKLLSQPFMHLRNTGGRVTSTLMSKEQAPALCDSNLFPPLVNDYLQSHGYNETMFGILEAAWAAASDEVAFVKALGTQGFAAAEAGFIWRLAEYDDEDF